MSNKNLHRLNLSSLSRLYTTFDYSSFRVEHLFLILKRLWGFAKVRHCGLAKNANWAFAMLAMLNISKWGRPLTGEMRPT